MILIIRYIQTQTLIILDNLKPKHLGHMFG